MTDIVERARAAQHSILPQPELIRDLADEIERLRAAAPAAPTREEIAGAIRKALIENWRNADTCEGWDEDILLTGCRKAGGGLGYQKPEDAAEKLALDAAAAVLALKAAPAK